MNMDTILPVPDTLTQNPLASWVVSSEICPKGTLHPSNDPEIRNRLAWGVFLQVAAMQLREYAGAHDAKEKEQWQTQIQETFLTLNSLNHSGQWGYQEEAPHPTPGFLVQSAEQGTWAEQLTRTLTATFGSAIPAITLRID